MLSEESTETSEAATLLNALDSDDTALTRVLISVFRVVTKAESATTSEDAARLNALDSVDTEVLRVLISLMRAVLSAESTAVNDDAEVLSVLEINDTADPRELISEFNEFNNWTFPVVMFVAKLGSFPIAVARSDSVFSVLDRESPAMAATLVFVNVSVASTLLMYLG